MRKLPLMVESICFSPNAYTRFRILQIANGGDVGNVMQTIGNFVKQSTGKKQYNHHGNYG